MLTLACSDVFRGCGSVFSMFSVFSVFSVVSAASVLSIIISFMALRWFRLCWLTVSSAAM